MFSFLVLARTTCSEIQEHQLKVSGLPLRRGYFEARASMPQKRFEKHLLGNAYSGTLSKGNLP